MMTLTEKQYKVTCARIEELLKVVSNTTSEDDKNYIELEILSNLVAVYEEANYPISTPSLIDVIKLRMFEMGLTQANLAKLLDLSPSRVSVYLSGKSEPPLVVARNISKILNIDPSIVLGI